MKIAVISDVHCHTYKEFSPNGERLMDCILVLQKFAESAKEHGADWLVFVGDLFHTRGIVNVKVFNAVYQTLDEIQNIHKFSKIVLLAGNHDQATISGDLTSLDTLVKIDGVQVITKPYFYIPSMPDLDTEIAFVFIPFIADAKGLAGHVESAPNVAMFIHAGINGATTGPNDYVMKEELPLEALEKFEWVCAGHYHKAQWLSDKVWYAGSPMQLNRGERNEKKGWWIVDTAKPVMRGTDNPKFIENNFSPRFIEVKAGEVDGADIANNFVTIVGETDEEIASARDKIGNARGIVAKHGKSEQAMDAMATDVNLDMSDAEIIARYAAALKNDDPATVQAGTDYMTGKGLFQ